MIFSPYTSSWVRRFELVRIAALITSLLLRFDVATATPGSVLRVEMHPTYNGETIQPSSLRYETASKESFSITRLSYLLSDFALQHADGSWLELSNSAAWLDMELDRHTFELTLPEQGDFIALRFNVGLNTNLNHADISKIPSTSPLNPNVNGLHWSWQGGYIFMALEGLWRNPAGELDGWSYHLARDTNLKRITLAADLRLRNASQLEMDMDVAVLLHAPNAISFVKDGSSTHSREGDPLAAALSGNLPGAFRIKKFTELTQSQLAAVHPNPLYLPTHYSPYPFQMSATFPIPALPMDNPLINERVSLGRRLFFDKRLSINSEQSCSTCHQQQFANAEQRRTSRGAEGEFGPRNAMPLFNLAWKKSFFWDGRAASLREQSLQPIQNPVEMHETLTNVVSKLTVAEDYAVDFKAAFGTADITAEKISLALEQFVITQVSCDSHFDKVMQGAEKFSAEEQHGFELFSTEYDPRRGQFGADCFHCHGGMLFQSQSFANNGLDETFTDSGRGKITGKNTDTGKFAVPSLRNVALTAPYMHDGRFNTLEEVVEHYSTGVRRSGTLDPNIAKHPDGGLHFSKEDKQALVAFLKTLTDPKFLNAQGN
jgi:cytochrome c peroxidase